VAPRSDTPTHTISVGDSRAITRWIVIATLLIVLLVAAALRLHRLEQLPLGLHYDEAANGILASEIARGLKRPIFISAYTGKEVVFFYWAAVWMKGLGVAPLALRVAAASMGVATVLAAVWAVHELFHDWTDGPFIALATGAFLAVSFWHVLLSRYGFRAISQPLLQALTVAALWRGFRLARPRELRHPSTGWLVLAGLFYGLTAYTYLAARAFPVPLTAALATLVLTDRARRRERIGQSAVFVGVAAVVLAPLAHYWLTHPGTFTTRATQVAADSWAEAWRGLLACLKMLFLKGDPYVRFNVPGRPLFGPIGAALFLVGLGATARSLAGPRRPPECPDRPLSRAAAVFLLVTLPVMLLPSALATGEITPSNLRTVGLLPFVYAFPAVGLWTGAVLVRRLLARRILASQFLLPTVCVLILGASAGPVHGDYAAWASSPSLYYAADGDLADAAEYLNHADLSGTTPYVASKHYRHPTVAFLADDYDAVRWLVGGRTLVFPPTGDALLLFPRSASEDLDWVRSMLPADALAAAPSGPDGAPAFHAFRSRIADAPRPEQARDVNVGQVAHLLGYTVTNEPRSGERVDIAVWWRVAGQPDAPDYRAVARLADAWGSIWGDAEPLHYPSEQWQNGALIVDHLAIPVAPGAPPGDYAVQVGLYAPGVDVQLPVLDDGGAYAGLYVKLPVHLARAEHPATIDELAIETRLDAPIDGATLLGVRLDASTRRPGEALRATLFWRAERAAPTLRALSLRLDGRTLYRGAPVHDSYPFRDWQPGEVIADRYALRVPLETPAGTYSLNLKVGDGAVLDLGEVTVQATDRRFEIPPISHPLTATLGDRVELLGYDLSSDVVAPAETVTLTLTWRALTEMTADYTVFTHLLGPDGTMTGQQDRQPVGGRYPTTVWAPGEVVTDVYAIAVAAAAAPGAHRLEVGMYDAETGSRLPVDGAPDDAVTLQTVSITE